MFKKGFDIIYCLEIEKYLPIKIRRLQVKKEEKLFRTVTFRSHFYIVSKVVFVTIFFISCFWFISLSPSCYVI